MPRTPENKAIQLTSLPPGLVKKISSFLPPPDLVSLARTCKSLRGDLKEPLQKRKDSFLQSQSLTRAPRESRFEALKDFLANTDPNTDVLNNIIAACRHIPYQQRPHAKQAIVKWAAKLLPQFSDVSTRLDEVTRNLESVDAFHAGIAQIMNFSPADQPTEFLKKWDDIVTLPQEHRLDALSAILDKTQDLQVLQKLPRLFRDLPNTDRSAALHAILDKTQNPEVLQKLAGVIRDLPNTDRSAGLQAILNESKNPEVLHVLALVIRYLPEANRDAGWHALMENTQDPDVLSGLAWAIGCLPSTNKSTKWQALLDKTKNPQVLKTLERAVRHLPETDRDAATRAIKNVQDQSA